MKNKFIPQAHLPKAAYEKDIDPTQLFGQYESAKKMTCKHCSGLVNKRNPSGYCDHLYYPENCEVCKKI